MDIKPDIASPFESMVFQDEAITPRKIRHSEKLPALISQARQIEKSTHWQSRQSIFLKQGKLLANYEDDYPYKGDPVRYFPTYQSLTNKELRGYFSWRTKVRKGIYELASLTFIFLYIYEIINNIGIPSPQEGYERLLAIKQHYGAYENKINIFLKQWLHDYIIYYNLDSSLLDTAEQVIFSHCLAILEDINNKDSSDIIEAVKQLAPKWLTRSRFYAEHYEDMNKVIYNVLKKMSFHYEKKRRKPLIEQLFGIAYTRHYYIFSQSIFCNPLNRTSYEYKVNDQYVYTCKDNIWTASCRIPTPYSGRKLEKLIKTIDCIMREEYRYKHPIKAESSIKWITTLIREETQALQAEKIEKEKKRINIDFSQLNKIREDANLTQVKLSIVEEDQTQEPAETPLVIVNEKPYENMITPNENPVGNSLDPAEKRLLQCLLYGDNLAWLKEEGLMVSVLIDGINEKLYDIFNDTVLEDGPTVVEDYISDLKEMLPA